MSLYRRAEKLTSRTDADGTRHALFPTARRTLCLRAAPQDVTGAGRVPSCSTCLEIAEKWDGLERCLPANW